MEFITDFILSILGASFLFGYMLVFLFASLETIVGVGLFIPGSMMVLISGALATQGYFDIWVLIIVTTSAAVLGDNFNYFLGKRYGARWILQGFWFVGEHHIERGKYFFDKHGAKSVFIGRFLPSVKEIVPFLAGVLYMRTGVFFLWNLLGSFGWSLAWLFTGYFFAKSLTTVYDMVSRAEKVLLTIAFVAIAVYILKLFIAYHNKLFPSQEKPLPIFEYKRPVWISKVADIYVWFSAKRRKNKTDRLFD